MPFSFALQSPITGYHLWLLGGEKPGGNFSMQKLFVDIWSVRSIPSLHVLYHSLEITETCFFIQPGPDHAFFKNFSQSLLFVWINDIIFERDHGFESFLSDPSPIIPVHSQQHQRSDYKWILFLSLLYSSFEVWVKVINSLTVLLSSLPMPKMII